VVEVAAERNSTLVMPVPVELLRFFEKMTPAGPDAGLSPSLADFGDAEVAEAEAAIEGRPPAAGPDAIPPVEADAIPSVEAEAIPLVEAIAIPPVEAIDIPPVQAPDIKVPEINADGEQAERLWEAAGRGLPGRLRSARQLAGDLATMVAVSTSPRTTARASSVSFRW
jgi:hypothetical protein